MLSNGDLHLKINCKKLNSGKCQVKFEARLAKQKQFYGYIIAEPQEKLKDVVNDLTSKLTLLGNVQDPRHFHLYSIGKETEGLKDFVLFQSKPSHHKCLL